MKTSVSHYSAGEKVAILRRHPLDKVPVSQLCEEKGLRRRFSTVGEGLEVRAQVSPARITDAEFLDELGVVYATLSQISHALAMALQFQLVESSGFGEQLRGRSKLLGQVIDALAEGEIAPQFDQTNHVAATPTSVTLTWEGWFL